MSQTTDLTPHATPAPALNRNKKTPGPAQNPPDISTIRLYDQRPSRTEDSPTFEASY